MGSPLALTTPRSSKRNVDKHPDGGDHSTIPAYRRTTSVSPWHRGRKPAVNKRMDEGVHKQAWWERFDDHIDKSAAEERIISTLRTIASAPEGARAEAAAGLVKLAALEPADEVSAYLALQCVDPGDRGALDGLYRSFFSEIEA